MAGDKSFSKYREMNGGMIILVVISSLGQKRKKNAVCIRIKRQKYTLYQ